MTTESVYTKLGQMIRESRRGMGYTQLDLAKKLGYESTQFVCLFEQGKSKVPAKTLGQLVPTLGLPKKKIIKMLVDDFENDLIEEMK